MKCFLVSLSIISIEHSIFNSSFIELLTLSLFISMYINQPNPVYFFVPYYIPYQVNTPPPVPKFNIAKEEHASDSEKE